MLNELGATETEQLSLFEQRVEDLRNSGLANAGATSLTVRMTFGEVPGQSAGFEGYNEDQFRSFMQTLRQFTMEKEPVFFYRICNIVRRRCTRTELLEWTNAARHLWAKTMKSSRVGLQVGSKAFDVEKGMELLWYGGFAHSDTGRCQEWERLSPGGRATVRFIVQHSITELLKCLHIIDSVIFLWLREPSMRVPPVPGSMRPGKDVPGIIDT